VYQSFTTNYILITNTIPTCTGDIIYVCELLAAYCECARFFFCHVLCQKKTKKL